MTCITPRALAADTIALLKPDSCQAIAVASADGAPLFAAIDATSEELSRTGVGLGAAGGTTRGAPGTGVLETGAPDGSLSTVPISRGPSGSSPFIHASRSTSMPA